MSGCFREERDRGVPEMLAMVMPMKMTMAVTSASQQQMRKSRIRLLFSYSAYTYVSAVRTVRRWADTPGTDPQLENDCAMMSVGCW